MGWEKSFLLALRAAPEADYYAFADQDDIWFDDKLISAVRLLEQNAKDGVPIMVHCNKLFKHGNIYYAPYEDLMDGYSDRLTADDKQFLKKITAYRRDIGAKLTLLFSPRFIRDSILGTLSLKAAILFNKL